MQRKFSAGITIYIQVTCSAQSTCTRTFLTYLPCSKESVAACVRSAVLLCTIPYYGVEILLRDERGQVLLHKVQVIKLLHRSYNIISRVKHVLGCFLKVLSALATFTLSPGHFRLLKLLKLACRSLISKISCLLCLQKTPRFNTCVSSSLASGSSWLLACPLHLLRVRQWPSCHSCKAQATSHVSEHSLLEGRA